MKRAFAVVVIFLVFFFSCSEPLDAGKVESDKIVLDRDSEEPLEVVAPSQHIK